MSIDLIAGCRERDPDSILVVDRHSGIGPPNPSVYLPRSSSVWMAFKVNSLGNRYKGWLATFTDAKIKARKLHFPLPSHNNYDVFIP